METANALEVNSTRADALNEKKPERETSSHRGKRLTKEERIERAKASKEWAVSQSKQALVELEESLRQGRSEALTRYLDVFSRFHKYSFRNVVLIALQRPDATHVAGFTTWKKLGRNVVKGEKGIKILAPIKYKKNKEVAPENSEEKSGREFLAGFKCVSVFEVSQTEGKSLPQFARVTGNPGEYLERLKKFVESKGIELEIASIPGGALGLSMGGKIQISAGRSPEAEFLTLAHELAHETMHRGEDRASIPRGIRELEAEAVAYAVCRAVGLDARKQSADYIQLHQGDTELLLSSLDRIQSTAASIIESLKSEAC